MELAAPATVVGLANAKSLVGSFTSYCARDAAGDDWCWGGFAGNDPAHRLTTSGFAARFTGLPNVSALSIMGSFACGVGQDGIAVCRGLDFGVFGAQGVSRGCVSGPCALPEAGTAITALIPVSTPEVFGRWCALSATGTLRCWGDNGGHVADFGLGTGATGKGEWPPRDAPASLGPVASACSGRDFGCALTAAGQVWCWGDHRNWTPRIRVGAAILPPTKLAGMPTVTQISCAKAQACALTVAGQVWCWGRLGPGRTPPAMTPHPIANLPAAKVIRVYATSSAVTARAIANDGTVWCWGSGKYGETGLGTSIPWTSAPTAVPKVAGAIDLAFGDTNACALLADGHVKC